MQKHLSKALAMAVMMSMLAGGQAYAQTFTETVVVQGGNNYYSEMGSDRFKIGQGSDVVHIGIYAGGMHAYGNESEGLLVSEGLRILPKNADVPYMAFTTTIVDVGNNVIKNVGEGDISSASSTDAVNGGQLYTALQGYVEKGFVASTAGSSIAVGAGSFIDNDCEFSVAMGQNARVGSLPLPYGAPPVEGGVKRGTAVGTGAIVLATRGTALGNNADVWYGSESSTAIGDRATVWDNSICSEAIGMKADVGKNLSYAVALGSESKATEANTVSVGNDTLKRKIVNVADGDITSATSTDVVTGGQIYTMTNVAKGNYIAAGTDVAGNLTALDTQVKINADDIATLKTDKADKTYVDTELAKKANAADVYTKSETESAISTAVNTATAGKADKSYVDTELGKKADKATTLAGYGITDAYTKSDTDTELAKKADQTALDTETKERKDADADLQKQIDAISGGSSAGLNELNNKINQTNDRVDRVGATAAALAAINYQPMAKGQSQVAVGMGGYKGKKATALGLAYQFNDRVSGSVAGAANGSEHMFNVGFNYLFGQHSEKDVAQMAAVPGSMSLKEAEMQATIDSQNAKINSMEARMAQLEAMVKALATK